MRDDAGWLLHAGDAYFFRGEMEAERRCPAGLRLFQTIVEMRRGQRLANQARLRTFLNDGAAPAGLRAFCAHDPVEFERLGGRG